MMIEDAYLLFGVSLCHELLYTNEHVLHLSFNKYMKFLYVVISDTDLEGSVRLGI